MSFASRRFTAAVRFGVLCALLLAGPLRGSAPGVSITDLGALIPYGINAAGVVVGDIVDQNDPNAEPHAGIWNNGTLTPLPENGATQSEGYAISTAGRVVGLDFFQATGDVHAVFWDGTNGPTTIPPFGSPMVDFSQAEDVDAAGNVVGATFGVSPHYAVGFYLPDAGSAVAVGIGDLDADKGSSYVGAISGDGTKLLGQVTGTDANDGYYLWSASSPSAPGVKLDLTPDRNGFGFLAGSVYTTLLIQNAIASDGAVFGYKGDPPNRTWWLRMPNGIETQVNGLTAHNGINAGHVIVGSIATGNRSDPAHAAKWDPNTQQVTDLNTLLPPNSGFLLFDAVAIGDRGEILGVAAHDAMVVGFLLKPPALTAQASVQPDRVKVDPNAVITVTATLQNGTGQTLSGVAPTGAPSLTGPGAADPVSGPTPASVDLAAGQSATITYTFKPIKGGKLSFTFPGFADASGQVHNDEGPVSTPQVTITDIGVDVSVTPVPLATDSSRGSYGLVRIKLTDSKGNPVVGQRVRLKVPRYVGQFRDLDAKVLLCDDADARIFPPGDNPILDLVRIATTPANGELTYGLWIGTERTAPPSTQLLVLAEAIDDNDALVADGSKFVDLGSPGQTGPPSLDLGRRALNDQMTMELPAGQRTDSAGITGRGGATAVLQSLIRWLESERERGLGPLQNLDFGPITSVDGKNAGVAFFPRGRGRAVLDHLNDASGANPPGDAFVLMIEVAQLDPLGRDEVQWTRDLMPLATWESTRPLNRVGVEDQTSAVRGRAVSATSLVTADASAFFGFPYPTVSPNGGYSGSCLPVMNGVGVEVHSPLTLLVKDANGNGVGFDATGAYQNDLEGGTWDAGDPSRYLLPPGSFTAELDGTDSGSATLVMSAAGASGVTTQVVKLHAKKGKTGTLTFDDTLAHPQGTFNKRKLHPKSGLPITISGLKRRTKLHAGDDLTLTVKDAFGSPVQGARVHATGLNFDAAAVTDTNGTAALALSPAKSLKLTLEIGGPGLQTKRTKVAIKIVK